MIGFLSGHRRQHHRRADPRPDRAPRPRDRSRCQKAWDVRRPTRASIDAGVAARRRRRRWPSSSCWPGPGWRPFGAVVALVVPTIARGPTRRRRRPGQGPGRDPPGASRCRPGPQLSAFSLSLLAGALAVAAIVLVQGVGVAESTPNPDGTRSDANVDFIAQGLGNVALGVLPGPAGRRFGRADRAEPRRRGAHPLGIDLLRASGCC